MEAKDYRNPSIVLGTAITYFIFNRPDHTSKSFEYLKQVKPSKLYIVADGPRTDAEKTLTDTCRQIVAGINWPCTVQHNYSDTNLGCKHRISSGIDWVFKQEEQAIFLEDDCLPGEDFLPFCESMLTYYQHDDEVMHIGANNFQTDNNKTNTDPYYFSKYAHIWGWATWKRAWEYYDVKMHAWGSPEDCLIAESTFKNDTIQWNYWVNVFNEVSAGKIDTWDFQWLYAIWKHQGKCIIPSVNLVENIGFDAAATHTKQANEKVTLLKAQRLQEIRKITTSAINQPADDYFFYSWFGIPRKQTTSLLQLPKQLLGLAKRKLTIK